VCFLTRLQDNLAEEARAAGQLGPVGRVSDDDVYSMMVAGVLTNIATAGSTTPVSAAHRQRGVTSPISTMTPTRFASAHNLLQSVADSIGQIRMMRAVFTSDAAFVTAVDALGATQERDVRTLAALTKPVHTMMTQLSAEKTVTLGLLPGWVRDMHDAISAVPVEGEQCVEAKQVLLTAVLTVRVTTRAMDRYSPLSPQRYKFLNSPLDNPIYFCASLVCTNGWRSVKGADGQSRLSPHWWCGGEPLGLEDMTTMITAANVLRQEVVLSHDELTATAAALFGPGACISAPQQLRNIPSMLMQLIAEVSMVQCVVCVCSYSCAGQQSC
jgi:hypothetical protein